MGRFVTQKKIGSKIWDGKNRVQKIGSGFFLLFRKIRGSLTSSLLNCKLQIASRESMVQIPEKDKVDATL
jgi:hypothetical protein